MARFARFPALAASVFLMSPALVHAETGPAQDGEAGHAQTAQPSNASPQGAAESQARGAVDQSKTTLKQIQNTERSREITKVRKAREAQKPQD